MKEIQDKFGSSRFLVVAISLDEQKSAMEAFLKKNPMPFAILRDEKGRLAEAIGVEKMPTSFILDAEGKVVAIHSGFDGEATRKQYLSQIEDAIKHVSKQN